MSALGRELSISRQKIKNHTGSDREPGTPGHTRKIMAFLTDYKMRQKQMKEFWPMTEVK